MNVNDEPTREDEQIDSGFEESIPRFWNMYASYVVGISFIVGLTLFMQVQSQLGAMREEVRSLNRYHQQLVHRDEHQRVATQEQERIQTLEQLSDKSLKTWKQTVEKLQAQVTDLRKGVEGPLRKLKRSIGDLQVTVSVMERRPTPRAPVKKASTSKEK